ncbi:ATP-NAD kinase family protein [Agromyces ramosus]|uniref:Polyphosphate/ATP-dependent NAD kinase n=1 Tax=Agromyces ramosus TaxID=33879 RepID=A0ABU0RB08_9MICO|nr:NAD(+)/NADH kinase [Agromyces ramosus]MDQ0895262.1 putative polyphosphate/ATP-dependent NAD kinase [Agromyces ramosus]
MLGLIVNPVAGIGGPAGLAGSDGAAVQARAGARGAASRAAERALIALGVVASAHPGTRVLTVAGAMGADVARAAGLEPVVVAQPGEPTDAADTTDAARALADAGASLVLFVGGDGTARDVAAGLGSDAAALGIPAGVKMYSPVFAVSPRAAGGVAAAWLAEGGLPVHEQEVLDVDEEALRHARVEPRLFGTLAVPFRPGRTQARKAATPADEHAAVRAAARGAASAIRPGVRYLLGPGGTMTELARRLGVPKTPLGVDVVLDGRRVIAGASEAELLSEIARGPARAVVTVIGGQGFLLGRGNQQLSARVLRALGDDPLLVVAPEQKLIDLGGRPLLVDTGDPRVDAGLAGFIRVITGPSTTSIYPVNAPEHEGEGHAP